MSDELSRRFNRMDEKIYTLEQHLRNVNTQIDTVRHEMGRLGADLNSAGNRIGSAIEGAGKAVSGMITEGFIEVQQELKATSFFAGKVELAKQLADLRATSALLLIQKGSLEHELNRIRKKKDGIVNKYSDQAKEIFNSYLRDIRRLGQHIYDIFENDFGRSVEERYLGMSLDNYAETCERVSGKRQETIEDAWQPSSGRLNDFIQQRRQFRNSINKNMLKLVAQIRKPLSVTIGFWRISDNRGEKRSLVRPSSIAKRSGSGHLRCGIQADKSIAEFSEAIEAQHHRLKAAGKLRTLGREEIDAMCQAIAGMKERGELSAAFAHYAQVVIRNQPPSISLS